MESLKADDVAVVRSRIQDRHVGAAGEHAWLLERHFAEFLLRQVSAAEEFKPEEFDSGWHATPNSRGAKCSI
jgi:hypothetical protein